MRTYQRLHSCFRISSMTLLFLVFLAFSTAFAGEQIEVEYRFDYPQTVDVMIDGQFYTRLVMPETPNCGNPGEPALPARGAQILLPYGAEVTNIEIMPGDRIGMGDGYLIAPVAPQTRLSADPLEIKLPEPDPTIYSSDQLFPGQLSEQIGIHSFRGYQILNLKIQPVQYVPSTGELYYYRDLRVIVNTENTGKTSNSFRGLQEDEQEVMLKVDNPDMAWSYSSAPKSGFKNYDLLIITTSALVSSFQPLKDYHDTTGILTEIHTTNDVGSNNPDDIRDYIYSLSLIHI